MALKDKFEAVLYTYVVGTFNVLGWHHSQPGGKNAGMRDGVTRMRGAIKVWNYHKLSVVALQECETPQFNEINRRRRWRAVRAHANNLLPGKNELFNAIAYRPFLWSFIAVAHLNVPMQGRPRGLNFVTLKVRHRWTRRRVAFVCFHFPRYGGNEDAAISRATVTEARNLLKALRMQLEADGYHVVILGDSNSPEASDWFLKDGFDDTFAHGVDAGAKRGLGRKFTNVTAVVAGVKGVLSDHPLVFASIVDKD